VALRGRLDVVAAELSGLPRAEVQRAIAAGRVRVDGRSRPKSFSLLGGEVLELDLAGMVELPAEGPAVELAYRDPDLVVVSKPPGLPTHPTANRRSGTLVNRLLGMGVPLADTGDPLRPGIVHRLDAGTSGLMVVACSEAAAPLLVAMFRRHEVGRRYLALVRGVVEHERFAVEAPLGRRGARIRVQATGARPAETRFDVLERFPRVTLLEATPRTGRTHQIRVHLSSVGHPILGDRRYGGGGQDAERLGLSRPFLHSHRLAFEHPLSGRRIRTQDPLPEDLERALRRVRGEG
jgi:23S rRNA pseudouridine1911/1915/1917 synthase